MGKRFIFILMACSLLSIATVVHAQHIDKQTYIFAIKGHNQSPSFFLHLGEVSKAGEEIIPITFLIFIFGHEPAMW